MFCQKRKKKKEKKICPCKCKNVCIQISILLGLQIHTHRGPRQSSGPGSGLDGGWPDWLSTRLAGGQGLSGGPGIITCEQLPLQTKALESSDKHGEWGPTATEVHVCFGLLLITEQHSAKPLSLQPLHQSNALVLQQAAGTLDGWCYSLLSGLAALWQNLSSENREPFSWYSCMYEHTVLAQCSFNQ